MIRLIVEIEDTNDQDFNITDSELRATLADFEEIIGKRNYSLYNTDFERENDYA